MDKMKWNNVLIEWVNCLKLCKNVQNIESLRNGEFLANLQKVITKSRNEQLDTLTFIFDLFSKHYPNYPFENKTEIHLSDLPEHDLKAITSLLMHYTCIFDRKDVLTSPLCHSLSQSTQLIIRNFLQKVTKDVNSDTLNNVIKSCIDDASDHPANNQWLTVETSTCTNSPLQDLLKTPVSKLGRLHEKDRIIAKLKTELDAERYDKTELQEELRKQFEKNKKIEAQLSQKNSEISRLRAEVVALENRTPPHYQDMDSRELQRRLRGEIQSLEHYIKQIEDEQEEIRREKDSAKELLRAAEAQASMWEEKFFETEGSLEGLREHSKKQEEELAELQAHCAEITAMLEEFRTKPGHDSSLYDTFTAVDHAKALNETPPCEDLACEVVEVQLREAQRQIEELREQMRHGAEVERELREVKEEIEGKLTKSERCNEELEIKVRETETDKASLQSRLSKVENDLHETNQKVQQKSTEIEELLAKLREKSENLQELDNDNKNLLSKVSSLQSDHEEVRKELSHTVNELEIQRNQLRNLESERDSFKTVSEKLQFEVADVVLNNQRLCTQLETLTNEKESLVQNLNQTVINYKILETNLFETQKCYEGIKTELDGVHHQNVTLKEELNVKNTQLIHADEENSDLKLKLQNANQQLNLLEENNAKLKSEISDLQNHLTEALNCIETSQKHRKELEDAQTLLEKQVSDTQSSLETLKVAFEQLQSEKKQTVKLLEANKASLGVLEQEKSMLASHLHQSEEAYRSLTKKNEGLISDINRLKEQLSDSASMLKTSQNETEVVKHDKKSLELELEENRLLYQTLTKSLGEVKLEDQKTKATLKDTEFKLQSSEEARIRVEKQLCETQKSVEQLTETLDEVKAEQKRVTKVIEENETQLRFLEEEKSTLEEQLHGSKQECVSLSKTNEGLKTRNEDLQAQLSETMTTLEKSKTEVEKLKKDLSDTQLENENVNKKLDEIESKRQKSETMRLKCEHQNEELQTAIQNLEKQVSNLQQELNLNKEEVERLINVRISLESELNEAQTVSETLRKDLGQTELEKQGIVAELDQSIQSFRTIEKEKAIVVLKLEESEACCNKLEQTLKKHIEDLQMQLRSAEEALKTSEAETHALLAVKTELARELKQTKEIAGVLKLELEQLQTEHQTLKEQFREAADKICVLQQEKEVSLKKIQDLEMGREKLLLDAENLGDRLYEVSHNLESTKEECNQLEEKNTELENRLKDTRALSENLKCEIATLQASCEANKDVCAKLEAEKVALEDQLQQLKTCNNNLEAQLRTMEDKSQSQKCDLEKLRSENCYVNEDLEQIKASAMKRERANTDLSTKLQESQTRNDTLRSTVTELEKRLSENRSTLDDRKHAQEILEQKLVHLCASIEEAEFDKQKANEDLMNAKNEIQILIAKTKDYELKYLTLEEKMANVINNLLMSTEENEEMRSRFEEEKVALTSKISELEEKLKELGTSTQDLISQKSDLEKEKEVHAEILRQFEKSKEFIKQLEEEKEYVRTVCEQDKESLLVKLTDLEGKIQDLRNCNDDLASQNKILQKDCEELVVAREEVCLENESYKKSSTDLWNERQKLEDVLCGEKEKLTKQLTELSEKWEKLEGENRDLILQTENLQQQISEISSEKTETQLQLQNLTELTEKLTQETKQLETKTDDYCNKNKELLVLNEELQNQLSAMERNYQQLKNNKEIVDRQLSEVSVLSETLKVESEDVRLQYQKSKIELSETRDALAQLVNERDNLVLSLKEANQKADELCKNLELIKEKLVDVNNRENTTKQALLKSENEVQMLNSKNEDLEKRLVDSEKKNKENREFLEGEVNKLTSMTFGYKKELEDAKKRAEKAEQCLKDKNQELLAVNEKLLCITDEKSILEKKIEVEEIISSEQKERAKSLEDTVQDYEITISGLKSVVDSNLERLEALKDELAKKKDEESDVIKRVGELLKDKKIGGSGDNEFKTVIVENFRQLVQAKNEEEERVMDLQEEIKRLKATNIESSSITEMIEKLQVLVAEKSEICSLETLKSSFDNIHAKVNTLLKIKQELSNDLQKAENDKSDLNKQIAALKTENDEAVRIRTELSDNLKDEKEKVERLRKELEIKAKPVKPEKENILNVSTKSNKSREEELKKENMMLKRKVVLTENTKNNLEKVLKELREEKKKASQVSPSSPTNDCLYKKLLQEYIQVKEENERVVKEKDGQIEDLKRENDQLRMNKVSVKSEDDKKVVQDLLNIREAYGNLMSVNSKLELEMVTLRKIIEERNSELADLSHIKEAYEKLLEENNKVLTEVDTVKYKRMRDKEEFVRLLKKEREETCNREMKRIQEIRAEYEGKLEKMKEKMLKLYREEVNKKMKSVKDGENETAKLLKTIANLKSELFEADQKLQLLEMEREMLKANRRLDIDSRTLQLQSLASITSITTNEERSVTLPRPSVTKEITISKRTSIGGLSTNIGTHDLQMEDEEDLFNDKYLTDLKEGRCTLPTGRDSVCRFSELAYRNSMVPPHLKSSYPAETQFISPTRFKDEDIKSGNLEFEDSLCKLLPGEKPRKKDFGTTSYKKPGPPTPSKNGGRLSLQGNEVHPMREHCEAKTPKKSTPSRIRALFTGRNSSTRDESQSSVTPSRGRRLNIFRRPR